MKKFVLLKLLVCFFILYLCSGIWSGCFSASQKKPNIKKTIAVEKKQQSKVSNENLPEIFIETTEYDAGVVYQGTIVSHSFIIKNKGKGDLHIKKVRPG